MVKFESNDMKTTLRFVERDLELVVGGRSGKK